MPFSIACHGRGLGYHRGSKNNCFEEDTNGERLAAVARGASCRLSPHAADPRIRGARCTQEFSAGNIPGFVHLYAGEEASGVGVCMHLDDRDAIASTHRGHGHCIAKGCDIDGMMHEIFGRKDGLCGGKGGSMHIADLSKGMLGANGIVGAGAPLVCGAALTAKTLKTGGVGVCFYGDGASNQGAVLESYNLAKIWNLPMVFVAEDNGYAESTASSLVGRRQPGRARRRVRHALARGGRAGLLRGLRGGGRGDRAGARRRRAVAAAHEAHALLRAFRGRRDDLPRARRGGEGAGECRSAAICSASGWWRRRCCGPGDFEAVGQGGGRATMARALAEGEGRADADARRTC